MRQTAATKGRGNITPPVSDALFLHPLSPMSWPMPVAAATVPPRVRWCPIQRGCANFSRTSLGPSLQGSSRTELEGADMKEIDGLLSHIDKITHDARSGHREDSHGNAPLPPCFLSPHQQTLFCTQITLRPIMRSQVLQHVCSFSPSLLDCRSTPLVLKLYLLVWIFAAHQELQEKTDEDSTSAPPQVKKGIDHVSKALEDVQKAEQSMKAHEVGDSQSHMSSGKKEAMIKKMKALQAQIAGDFKHVTSFGNKAGYLPPVKVPHV